MVLLSGGLNAYADDDVYDNVTKHGRGDGGTFDRKASLGSGSMVVGSNV
jgi:hypothetical protein